MPRIAATETRLAIGPANYAGQAYFWCEAVARYLNIPSLSFWNRQSVLPVGTARGFRFPVHRVLPHHRVSTPLGKRLRIERLLEDVTHLAVDGFLPLYSRLDRSHVGADIPRLLDRGLRLALIAHGGDVRDPDEHMARYSFSFFRDAPSEWVDVLRQRALENRRTVAEANLPVFVSTPDLLMDLPTATWLPLAINLTAWHSASSAMLRDVPVVLHIPSRRNPPIKGTTVIEPILRKLHERGRIRLLAPESVPHGSMHELVGSSDVVVDQILTGSYGVTAVEGMAAGRLVIGYVGNEVRDLLPGSPPIVDAAPAEFRDVMEHILSDCDSFAELASIGPAYVERWHSGLASAAALKSFLLTSSTS